MATRSTRNIRTLVATLAVAALTLAISPAARAVILMDTTGGSISSASDRTVGYRFSTSDSFLISDFGFFDVGSDGLAESHSITLYTDAGAVIETATIAAGTGAPLLASSNAAGSFRTVDVPDFALPAGTYVMGAYYSGSADGYMRFTTLNTAAGVTHLANRVFFGNGFPSSDNPGANFGFIGPTLIGTVAVAVPEAGSLALVLPALGVLGAVVIRRKRVAA